MNMPTLLVHAPAMSSPDCPSPLVFSSRRVSVRCRAPPPILHSARIRPLPPIPRLSPVGSQKRPQITPASLSRPLPSLPPPSNSPSIIRISITPPYPPSSPSSDGSEPPLTPDSSDSLSSLSLDTHSAKPPLQRRRRPRRPDLRIQLLDVPPGWSSPRGSIVISPLSPSIPQVPSPTTTKRKQINKVRRYLGEPIPVELIFGKRVSKASLLEMKLDSERDIGCLNPRGNINKVMRRDSEESNSSSSTMGDTMPQISESKTKRYSRKWIREQAGRRWVEEDYKNVLQALRAL